MSKLVTLLLITVLILSSLVMIGSAFAQSTKPSVPEFTVRVIDRSYDVPATTTTKTDFDGRRITTTSPGYHVANGSIDVSIKNQPFSPYYDSDGYPIELYYRIRIKGTESADWALGGYFKAKNSTTDTVILNYLGYSFESNPGGFGILGFSAWPLNDTLSFQVEAFIGHTKTTSEPIDPMFPLDIKKVEYIGQSSGWSNTQTVTLPNASDTTVPPQTLPTPQPTTTPTSPYNPIETPTPTTFSTSATVQFVLGGTCFILRWEQIVMALIVTVAILLVTIAVLVYKITTK